MTVTGLISFFSPEYSPTASAGSEVLSVISFIHCRAATMLVQTMSVLVLEAAIAPKPTRVLPAPHGKTITPDPPRAAPSAQYSSTARF